MLVVDNDNPTLKREFVTILLAQKFDTQILLTLLTGQLLNWVVAHYKQNSEFFWELICELCKRETEQNLTTFGIVFEDLTQILVSSLRELKINEVTSKDQD